MLLGPLADGHLCRHAGIAEHGRHGKHVDVQGVLRRVPSTRQRKCTVTEGGTKMAPTTLRARQAVGWSVI